MNAQDLQATILALLNGEGTNAEKLDVLRSVVTFALPGVEFHIVLLGRPAWLPGDDEDGCRCSDNRDDNSCHDAHGDDGLNTHGRRR